MDQGTRKKKRSSKRSSILKIGRSPPRGALCDLDPNAPLEDDTRKLRLSRRVSFAETCQVKEFVKDSWNSSNQQHPGSEQDARATENTDPSAVSKNISGLDSLLNGEIKSDDICGKTTSVANFGEANDVDDDVFLPDDALNFQSGTNMEITKCAPQQFREDSNGTILSQTTMDFTCVVNNQGSSVSSTDTNSGISNRTILSSSDMNLTTCVESHLSGTIPGIMITRPSDEEAPPENIFRGGSYVAGIPTADSEVSPVKLSTTAFLKKISVNSSGNNNLAIEQSTSGDNQPNVSENLVNRTASSFHPVIYVPERPLSPSTGKRNVPREPYSLNNDTDFDTIINTSVNKYTGKPRVLSYVNSSLTATTCKTTSTEHTVCNSSDDTTAMELTACLGLETERCTFSNWSTETTRVFGTENTSKMDLTFGHEIGINAHVRNANTHVFPSQLQSALNTVTGVGNETKFFSGDDTADMEFTACLTSNLAQLKCGVTAESPKPEDVNCQRSLVPSSATPYDITQCIDADMEITLCNINNKSQPNSTSPVPIVDSRAFLKKLTCGNSSSSQNTTQNNICNPLDVERNGDGIASFKIDAQAFLNKLKGTSSTREGSNIQDTDIPTRERKTTEGSEDMEFTACLNQISSDVCHEELNLIQPSYQKILDSTSPAPVVDSGSFLKKLTCGNISSSQNTTQNNICNPLDVGRNEDGIASFKIDAQAFLNKLKGTSSTREGSNIQDTEIPTRERNTTEGSEDMEFTACLNQISSDVCHEELHSTQPNYQKILETEVLVDDTSNKKAPEHIPPDPEQTHIFHHEEENMEFTSCISGTLKEASRVEEQTSPVTDKTKVFSSEENMEFTACFGGTLKSNDFLSEDVSILGDKSKIFDSVENDNMEFTTCLDTAAGYTTIAEKDNANFSGNALIIESESKMEGVQVMSGKLSTEKTFPDNDFDNGREAGNTATLEEHSEGLKPRKRAHPNSDANTFKNGCGPIDYNRNANEESQKELSLIIDKSKGVDGPKDNTNNTKRGKNWEDTKTSEEIEPDLPSPVPEEVTGLKGLMNKVKKARKSIGSGETTCVFTSEMTLAQMDLTTCIGGNDLHGSSEKSPVKQEKNLQPDTTRIFQQDEMTSAMEVTKCVTTSLPSVNERANDLISSGGVPDDVAVAVTLDKLPLNQTSQMKSSSTEKTLGQESNTKDRSSSTESVDIMNEMPPSLMEISVNSTTQSAHKSAQSTSLYESVIQEPRPENMMTEPLVSDAMSSGYEKELTEEVQRRNEMVVNGQNLSVENICDGNSSDLITNETLKAAEKSLLHNTELEYPTMTRSSPNDLSKTSEDAMKDSLLLSVATMNKSFGLLPANASSIEPKVTKGLSSISFVQKDQLSLCDEPPKSTDDFLALLGFYSYNDRLCRRSTLAPYSMKSPETLSEHLELGAVIEPKVQVYEWACDQMEAMTKKLQRSNDDVGTSLQRNLPQPFVEVTNPETSSKVKQAFKPIIRSCKLKADQIIKEWRSKMVNSEMDALRQETQLMQKAVQQLRDGISSLDIQLSGIQAESSKLGSILEDIEKEEPASDEQVQQFEDYEEQILTVTAELNQKEEREQSLRSELQVIRTENELLIKQIQDMKDVVNNCPSPQIPHVSQDVLWEQADDIHLCTEWELKSISEDHIVISWLFNSLDMNIELAPSASNKTPQNRYLISIKFVSQLSDDAAPWAFLAQRMVTEAVSTRVLDAKYPTTKDLGKMLEELSPIVWNARLLGDEMSDVCLFHDTVINGCEATVKFVSLAAFAKFTVTFKFQPGKYPMEPLEWDLNCEVGDLGRDDLDPVLARCQPGQFYLHRLVKSIQSFLESRAQEIKTTHWS